MGAHLSHESTAPEVPQTPSQWTHLMFREFLASHYVTHMIDAYIHSRS